MPLCGELQLALPVLRLTELGRPADNEGDKGRGRGNELCLLTKGGRTDRLQPILDATQMGMSVYLTALRLPRLSYKQKANQERKESGQPKFLTRPKRRHRDPTTPAHKSRITKMT